MPNFIETFIDRARRFRTETDGAVTADFVVLTAGVVALAIFMVSPLGIAPAKIGEDTNERIVQAGERIFSEDFIRGRNN